MSVPNQTPYIIYNANGLTTVFPFEFYIISSGDLRVTFDGIEITSGYSVSGAGNIGGGDVIFVNPPVSGTVVMLERVVPTYRLTDYQDNGDLLADTVNKDFDRLWMAIQRSFLFLNRTLRVPEYSGVNNLPSVEMRKNKLLAFNDAGQPIAVPPQSGSASDVLIELAKPTGAGLSGYRAYTIQERLDVMLTTSAMGAIGDEEAEDTAAIQSAINTLAVMTKRATLYVDGRSKVSTLTIPATLSLHIVGNNLSGASYDRSALIGTSGSNPLINCLGAACSFDGVQFVGASNDANGGSDTTQTAILFNPGAINNYNCDGYVKDCGFVFFNKIFDLRGRNLKVEGGVWSNSAFGVWIGTTGLPDFRGLDVKNVRMHYMSASAGIYNNPKQAAAIFIDPATQFHTINISGCLGDGCKWVFVGAFPWGAISGNEFVAQQTGVFYQDITGSTLGSAFQKTSLSGNTINGTYITAGTSSNMIHIANGWGVDVNSNVLNNASAKAIYNLAAGSTISNNTIKNPSFIDSGHACIESSGANSSVLNNVCINTGQGNGTPGKAIKLNNFTFVDGNKFPSGYSGNEWDIAGRGNTLIYGKMDIAALPSEEWGTAAPTSGRYLQGSIVRNTNVLAGGTLGWVCVASGSPGTWKGYGGVAP
ncbi:hypothetical protein [Enterobacter cloacae]